MIPAEQDLGRMMYEETYGTSIAALRILGGGRSSMVFLVGRTAQLVSWMFYIYYFDQFDEHEHQWVAYCHMYFTGWR